jgi:L-ascorbate metabolism protein UlaG (beta-lactamase superfamily)
MSNCDLTLTLVGGPTVLIDIGAKRLITDPTFDEPGSYQGGVTLTKTSGPAVAAEAVGDIDAVLLSHDQHFDNLDRAGRALLPRARRVLTTEAGAARLDGHAEGLRPWDEVKLDSLRVTATPARHGPVGIEPISGDVLGFAITPEGGSGRSVYISGDTVWFDGVAEVARRFDIGVAVLFTGSAKPRGAFHMTMDANDAIEAAHAFPNATIVAIHNEGWEHFTETQDELALAFEALGLGARLERLQRGVPVQLRL